MPELNSNASETLVYPGSPWHMMRFSSLPMERLVCKSHKENSSLKRITCSRDFSGSGNTQVTYGYDNLDRVDVVEDGAGVTGGNGVITPTSSNSNDIANYSFYGPGRLYQRIYSPSGNAMTTQLAYDNARRVTQIQHSNLIQPVLGAPQAVTLTFNYAFDREGNPHYEQAAHEFTGRGLDVFKYDSAYRLAEETRDVTSYTFPSNNTAPNSTTPATFGDERTWSLDGVTNWRSVSEGPSGSKVATSRSVNAVNEYNTVGGTTRDPRQQRQPHRQWHLSIFLRCPQSTCSNS